ncbi:MAG: DUF305 domain-containing protein, partial [Pedobacter sp.]
MLRTTFSNNNLLTTIYFYESNDKRVLIAGTIFSMTACTKDDGLKLQAHNENRMMDSMHAMMARMEAMPMTNDPEIDFPKMMIMHHQGAINMGNVQIQEGKNDSLKRFSRKMIDA